MTYILMFYEFFKTGLFAIGGGLATLPFLYNMADKYTWFDKAMLSDMIAVSESTPGPLGVNLATYTGFTVGTSLNGIVGGILGALVATVGLVAPSVIIIIIIAKFLAKFDENKFVQDGFYGLRPAVTALIAVAGYQVFSTSVLNIELYQSTNNFLNLFDIRTLIIFAIIVALTNIIGKHPIYYIAGAAVVGIVLKL